MQIAAVTTVSTVSYQSVSGELQAIRSSNLRVRQVTIKVVDVQLVRWASFSFLSDILLPSSSCESDGHYLSANKTGSARVNVTLRRVRVTVVAFDKQ